MILKFVLHVDLGKLVILFLMWFTVSTKIRKGNIDSCQSPLFHEKKFIVCHYVNLWHLEYTKEKRKKKHEIFHRRESAT